MRERMGALDSLKQFDAIFKRYLRPLPLYADFTRIGERVDVFICCDKGIPYPKWEKAITYYFDYGKTVQENIHILGEQLSAFFPRMVHTVKLQREPTISELKKQEGFRSVEELLKSKITISSSIRYVIERVDVRRDQLVVRILDGKDAGTKQVYRTKRPASILVAMLLREKDEDTRFKLFSANTAFLKNLVPAFAKGPTVAWAGNIGEGECRQ